MKCVAILSIVLISISPVFARYNFSAITGGEYHTIALNQDYTLRAWGCNINYGPLGDGTTERRYTPVKVVGPDSVGFFMDAKAIAAGLDHSVALKQDSTVWAWGKNTYGELGDGTTSISKTPVQVVDSSGTGYLTGIVAISTSNEHTLALGADSTVWAWGYNYNGQLGIDSSGLRSEKPVQVVSSSGFGTLTGIVAVAAGHNHSLALKADGTVWAWGDNLYGQLGNGGTADRYWPVQVVNSSGTGYLTDVIAIAAGCWHSVALKSDGTVWTWGKNTDGQLGNGNTELDKSTRPVQVLGPYGVGNLTGVVDIKTGWGHTVALTEDSIALSWGRGEVCQLGNGDSSDSYFPVYVYDSTGVELLRPIVETGVGWYHNFAIMANGVTFAWGHNNMGQLGNGTTAWRTPLIVEVEVEVFAPEALITSPLNYTTSSCEYQGVIWFLEASNDLDTTSIEVRCGDSLYTLEDAELSYQSLSTTSGKLAFMPSEPWGLCDTVKVCLTELADTSGLSLWDSVCSNFYIDRIPPVLKSREPDSGFVMDMAPYGMSVEYSDEISGVDSSCWELVVAGRTFAYGDTGISMSGDSIILLNFITAGVEFTPDETTYVELTVHDTPDTCAPNETTYAWWFLYTSEYIEESACPEEFGIFIYPNPFNSSVTISLVCHSCESGNPGGRVMVEIYDINGRNVANIPVRWSKSAEPSSTNASRIGWQPDESLPSGVYLVRVKNGDKRIIRKIVYLR